MNKPQILRFTVAAAIILGAAGAGINLTVKRGAVRKDVPLRLVLNVPAHKLYVFENGKFTREFRVAVGMPGNETPAGSYRISNAVWNPWWNPPPSPWAEGRKPEPPGPTNPMGRVKMNFAPLLYIHGTAYKNSVGDPSSHGCVHVLNEDLLELARIVHKYATPNLDASVLDELADNPSETRQINFRNSIPFDVVYSVADVKNNFLYVFPDVYGRMKPADYETQVRAVLAENGIDYDNVDHAKIQELVNKASINRVSIPLDELVTASPVATTSRTPSKKTK